MSAILSQTRQNYAKAIAIFAALLFSLSIAISFVQFTLGLTFFYGGLSAFLPFCLAVYWMFFRQSSTHSVAAFYQSEGLKWSLTILLIVLFFLSVENLHYFAFFAGYFFALMGNTLLPLFIKRKH